MISYIKSELYRILHYKWTYLFIAICSTLLVSSNIVLAAVKWSETTFPYGNTAFSIGNFIGGMSFVFILCITVGSMVFGNEHGNHTMKNSVSYGIPRGMIYVSKLLVEIIYAVVAFFIITGFHVASAYLLLEHSHLNELYELGKVFIASFPIYLFVLAMVNCFAFIFESTGAAIGADVGLAIAFPIVGSLLGMKFDIFNKLAQILPWNIINGIGITMDPYAITLPWKGDAGYYNCWIASIVQMILITVIGYVIIRRKEIK
jgi:ABC-2 type transport system permease protein